MAHLQPQGPQPDPINLQDIVFGIGALDEALQRSRQELLTFAELEEIFQHRHLFWILNSFCIALPAEGLYRIDNLHNRDNMEGLWVYTDHHYYLVNPANNNQRFSICVARSVAIEFEDQVIFDCFDETYLYRYTIRDQHRFNEAAIVHYFFAGL